MEIRFDFLPFHRAYSICSSQDLFNDEVKNLRIMFSRNGYTFAYFNKVLSNFLSKMDIPKVDRPDTDTEYAPIFKVPFVGKASILFQKEICKLIFQKFGIKIRAVYSSCKVGDFFSLKSVAPSSLSANVVYKFTCSLDARTSYIGKTERHLVARMEEHLNPRKESAVTKHISQCLTCQNNANFDNFSIIQRCRCPHALMFHETLCIRRYKPNLNIQLLNNGGSVLTVF